MTAADLGKVIGLNGRFYATTSAAETAGTTALAVIAYDDQGNDQEVIDSYFERGRELGVRATSVFSCAINPLKILPYFTPIRDK